MVLEPGLGVERLGAWGEHREQRQFQPAADLSTPRRPSLAQIARRRVDDATRKGTQDPQVKQDQNCKPSSLPLSRSHLTPVDVRLARRYSADAAN